MNIQSYSQDGVMYELITDRDDQKELLKKAANGEIVLYAMLMPHAAKLKAYHWAESPKSAERITAAGLVPLQPKLVTELIGVQCVTLKSYPATGQESESPHPWDDHYFWLEQPQKVTLAQVYCKIDLVESEGEESELTDIPDERLNSNESEQDVRFANAFTPVKYEALEAMFPSDGKWKEWTTRAGRNGLAKARRKGSGLFNPYLAAEWWLENKNPPGWKRERCLKVLFANYPAETQEYRDYYNL